LWRCPSACVPSRCRVTRRIMSTIASLPPSKIVRFKIPAPIACVIHRRMSSAPVMVSAMEPAKTSSFLSHATASANGSGGGGGGTGGRGGFADAFDGDDLRGAMETLHVNLLL